MPLSTNSNSDSVYVGFLLPEGTMYTVTVTGLMLIQTRLSMGELQSWYERIQQSIQGPVPPLGWTGYIDDALSTLLASRTGTVTISTAHSQASSAISGRNDFLDVVESRITVADWAVTFPAPPAGPPNDGLEPASSTPRYLGYAVRPNRNVAPGSVVIQSGTIHYYPTLTPDVWQAEARRQIARILRRSAPVSIRQNCRLCGKAYPARQTLGAPDAYCSDRCRERAADLIDCTACNGTGAGREQGDKCGECFGSSYMPCAACSEDHARAPLAMLAPDSGTIYHVCPSCVPAELDVGATLAPQERA